jgi:GntR family transcriptional regulator/MocR family aminotransferase
VGVDIYPVERHAIVKGLHLNEIILGYSHLSPEQIEQGIGKIKLVIG